MLYKMCPFEENSLKDLLYALQHKEIVFPESPPVSSKMKDILKVLLTKDPDQRV